MKATGIVRRIDDLGRIVIPREIRKQMHIEEGDPLEIYTDGEIISFTKYRPLRDDPRTITEIIGHLTDEYTMTLDDEQDQRNKINEVIDLLEKAQEKIKEI